MYGDEIELPLDKDIWNVFLEPLPHLIFGVRCHFGYEQGTWGLQVSDRARWLQGSSAQTAFWLDERHEVQAVRQWTE